ncbi:MAG: hypothetical protein KAS67_00670 [Thermoplasmata archaeon]|nr:hypothetical protein [Thermoplasmata archaeon]
MSTCELCGEEVSEGKKSCPRCGFEFPAEIRADARDDIILKKHDGKEAKDIKRGLAERFSKYISYFENMDPERVMPEEFAALVEEAVSHLHIPMVLELGDVLRFSKKEEEVLVVISSRLLQPDSLVLVTRMQTRTIIMLANGLYTLDMTKDALEMVELAVHQNPRDSDALYAKAKLFFFDKNYAGAKKCLEKVREREPERDDVQYLLEMIAQIS